MRLDPFDPDSTKRDLFAEIMNTYDVEQLANALISSGDETPGPEWRRYARTCFSAVARRCKQSGAHELTEPWSRVIEELQEGKRRPLSWPG